MSVDQEVEPEAWDPVELMRVVGEEKLMVRLNL
jgi:hypothetical protein